MATQDSAPLTPAQFLEKWLLRFAYNQWEKILDAAFREHTGDLAALLGALAGQSAAELLSDSFTASLAGQQVIAVPGATSFGTVSVNGNVLTLGTEYTTQAEQLTILAAAGVQVGEVVQYHYLTGSSAAPGPVTTALGTVVLTTDQARRVSPALPVLEPVSELVEVLRDNAAQALYQLDKDVYSATPSYGQPDRTRAQVLALLQALTPAERAAGVELSVKVVPTASSQASTAYVRLNGVAGFVAATRAGFPTANEVPGAFYAAGDSWEENEPGKWIYGSNWLTYPDASYSGGNCAYLNAGTAGQAVLDKPVIGAALNFQLGGGAMRSTTVEARVWSSTGTGNWTAIGVANQVGQNLIPLPNPNNYYQIQVSNTPGASGALTLLDLTQVQ